MAFFDWRSGTNKKNWVKERTLPWISFQSSSKSKKTYRRYTGVKSIFSKIKIGMKQREFFTPIHSRQLLFNERTQPGQFHWQRQFHSQQYHWVAQWYRCRLQIRKVWVRSSVLTVLYFRPWARWFTATLLPCSKSLWFIKGFGG